MIATGFDVDGSMQGFERALLTKTHIQVRGSPCVGRQLIWLAVTFELFSGEQAALFYLYKHRMRGGRLSAF